MNHPSPVTSPYSSLPPHSFHTSHPVSNFKRSRKNAIEHIEWLLKMWLPSYLLTYISDTGEQISVGNLESQISTYDGSDGSACYSSSCSTVNCSALEPSCEIETSSVSEVNTLIDESSQIVETTQNESSSLTGVSSLIESNCRAESFLKVERNLLSGSRSPAGPHSCNEVYSCNGSHSRINSHAHNESHFQTESHSQTGSHTRTEANCQIDPQLISTDPCISELNTNPEVDRLALGNLSLSILQPIFMDWGIDLYHITSDEITYKIHELMIVTRSLTGTMGKKTTVAVLKELYPARRKYFPYASGYCPGEFWPGNIRYYDPSHLNCEERFALLVWAYANPEHNMKTIVTAHKRLQSKHNITLQYGAESVIYQLRKAMAKFLSTN